MWEVVGPDLINYNPESEKQIIPLYESLRYFLADFLDAYKKGEISTFNMDLDRTQYNGEVLIWANTGDQDFGPQIARLICASYPHSKLAIFEEKAHHTLKKDEYQLVFTGTFFKTGLYSAEIANYFDDNRQLNK